MSHDTFDLEQEISSALDEYLADDISSQGIYCGGEKYEFEECDEPDDPWVLVRKSDGQRFELEVQVYIYQRPPKPAAKEEDPDAPVHIEGQEERPLGIGAS